MHSVVVIKLLTEAASSKATLTTFVGSIIPSLIKFVKTPFYASNPYPRSWLAKTFSTIETPSNPALSAIVLQGNETALETILIPRFCSEFSPWSLSRTREA